MTIWTILAAATATFATPVASQAFPDCTSGPLANNGVCDTTLDPWTRAEALVKEFTLQEKITNSEAEAPGIPRMGIPKYTWWNEALHGVARSRGVSFADFGDYSYATSFPQPLTMGAAFDMPMMGQIADIVSTEARAFSNGGRCGLNFWTPNINPFRDPRWGRGQEVPSEDAFFISTYVKQLIPGLQGGLEDDHDPYWKLVATCKHFVGYDLENWQGNQRYGFDAKITAQDLRDYYIPPFQSCIRDARAMSVMCSYNAVNGLPTCADPWLLNTLLRDHWDWTNTDQWVTADCDSLRNVWQDHHYGSNAADAAAITLNSGTDLDCGDFWPQNLGQAIQQGITNETMLDLSYTRRFASLVRLGFFDPAEDQPFRQIGFDAVATDPHKDMAIRAATEGLVLVKNQEDAVLPFDAEAVKTIAVVGPHAGATTSMQGNYYGIAKEVVSPTIGFERAGFTVISAQGCDVSCGNDFGFSQAVQLVGQAEAVVFVGGIDTSIEAEDRDRNSITWPGRQLDLVKQLAAEAKTAGKPFVVVQMGTSLDSTEILESEDVGAVIWAGYPGQDGGTAIAKIVSGEAAPAGRMPVTVYPGSYTSVPMTDMNLKPGAGNPGRTYKWYTGTPVVPFGHGLHYTTFNLTLPADLPISFTTANLTTTEDQQYLDLAPFVPAIPVTVENTGDRTSDFVVLAFLKGEFGPEPYPIKSLVSFTRVHGVAAGETAEALLEISIGSIARADENGDHVLFPGSYELVLDLNEEVSWMFEIEGEPVVLDSYPAGGWE